MQDKEQKYFTSIGIVVFLGLLLLDKNIEALLVLIVAHLIDLKYEIRKLDKYRK